MRYALQLSLITLLQLACNLGWAARVGETAPDFSVTDTQGRVQSLQQYRGQYVVLEWYSPACPYVADLYKKGLFQQAQKAWTDKKVVWIAVISSAPGKPGFVDAAAAEASMKERNAAVSAILLDPSGALGRSYGAKTTPHLFVIDPRGNLIYNGAFDEKSYTYSAEGEHPTNYVTQALQQATHRKPVATASTQPYGCSIKY